VSEVTSNTERGRRRGNRSIGQKSDARNEKTGAQPVFSLTLNLPGGEEDYQTD
jgi:hypothetical protein